jgi:hypothetical protein
VPEPPDPLRYEVHGSGGREFVFASALLFRHEGLHNPSLPFLRISYPQLSLRLYVTDADGTPAVLFSRVVVPYWVVPVSRLIGRQPAHGGFFSYPEPSFDTASGNGDSSRPASVSEDGEWIWSLRGRGRLEVKGKVASPRVAAGPDLGGWQRTVDYIRRRPLGYVQWDGGLRSLTKSHPRVPVWPLAVELGATELLQSWLPRVEEGDWIRPHSAWLCPEIPFTFEVGRPRLLPALPARHRVVAPVADGC